MQRPVFISSIFASPLLRTRPPLLVTLLLTLFLLATAPAFSQPANSAPARDLSAEAAAKAEAAHPNESGTAPAPKKSSASPANSSDPQIVVDKKNHAVRILIDGKEIAIIDASGMHVNGGLDFSGVLKDTGGVPYAK